MNSRTPSLRNTLRHNKYLPRQRFEFEVNSELIFSRFATPQMWQQFSADGTINIPGIFNYLLSDPEIMEMINQEFEMYNWHYYIEGDGTSRRGWLRNMYYSLVQQVVRIDPVYYALNVACRPDRNWRLISVPYYTKDTRSGESTGFLHLDMNVHDFYTRGKGPMNMIQGCLSLDEEKDTGCTTVVKGFQKHIRAWWADVIERGEDKRHRTCGNTDVKGLYNRKDQEKYGVVMPDPCPAGGIRLTRAEIIHGSTTTAENQRRVIFPWFTGVGEDHNEVDVVGAEPWSKLAEYHRKMVPPMKQASGRIAGGYGELVDCLIPKIALESPSAIGNALVGRSEWSGIRIMKELSVLFGADDGAATAFIKDCRKKIIGEYKAKFRLLEELERETFKEASFFQNWEKGEGPIPDGEEEEGNEDVDLDEFEEEEPDSDVE